MQLVDPTHFWQYPGRNFKIPTPTDWWVILTDFKHISEVAKAPEHVWSALKVVDEVSLYFISLSVQNKGKANIFEAFPIRIYDRSPNHHQPLPHPDCQTPTYEGNSGTGARSTWWNSLLLQWVLASFLPPGDGESASFSVRSRLIVNESLHLDQSVLTYDQSDCSSQQPSLCRCSIMWVIFPRKIGRFEQRMSGRNAEWLNLIIELTEDVSQTAFILSLIPPILRP